jgi:dolichol kinase
MSVFINGFNTLIFNVLLTIILLIYFYMFIPIVHRAFKENHKNKWTTLINVLLIFIISILNVIRTPDDSFFLPFPLNHFAVVFAGGYIVAIVVSTKVGKTKNEQFNTQLTSGLDKAVQNGENISTLNFNYRKEFNRKLIHMLSMLYIVAFVVCTPLFNLLFNSIYINGPQRAGWEEYYNFYVLGSGQFPIEVAFSVTIFVLIGSFWVVADGEIMRLRSPEKPFLLKKTLQKTRRVSETKTFGAHISMILALILAGMILYYTPSYRPQGLAAFAATISTTSLGDMMAALIGRKFGHKKWKFNKDKSYAGSFAGAMTTFIMSYIFVGEILAIVAVIVFLFTDLALAKVNLSDNLTTPIILAVVYRILIFLVASPIPYDWFLIPVTI